MINFITPLEDKEPLYGGVTERLMFWAFIKAHFPQARRVWTAPGYANSVKRYAIGPLRVIWLLLEMALGRNRVFILFYPNFPFMPTQGRLRYVMGLSFFLAVKVITVVKRGTIAIRIHDAPRLARGDVIDDYAPAVGLRLMKLFEKVVFGLTDILWVTSRPQCDLLATDLGLDRRKIRLSINGTPRSIEAVKPVQLDTDGCVNFVYAGSLAETKGIRAMLDAFLSMEHRKTRLFLTGVQGEWIAETYEDPRLCYLGCLPRPNDAAAIVKACDVALLPYPPGAFSNIMFPNKLSFYITCGTPQLTTDIEETARIVRENQVGLSCPLDEMSKMMDYMVEHPEIRDRFRRHCQRIKDEYFWETIFNKALGDLFPEQFPQRQLLTIRLSA